MYMNVQDFREQFPEIQASDMAIAAVLTEAVTLFGGWAEFRVLAQSLYVAHVLTLQANPQFASGVKLVTSRRVGEVQANYAESSGEQSWYDLTGYGQRFWALLLRLRARGQGAFVV